MKQMGTLSDLHPWKPDLECLWCGDTATHICADNLLICDGCALDPLSDTPPESYDRLRRVSSLKGYLE